MGCTGTHRNEGKTSTERGNRIEKKERKKNGGRCNITPLLGDDLPESSINLKIGSVWFLGVRPVRAARSSVVRGPLLAVDTLIGRTMGEGMGTMDVATKAAVGV